MSEPAGRRVRLRGVRTHNLAGIDVDFPRGAWTTIVGLSGSGKSSLAFDTLHAECQHRFLSALAPEARRFLDRIPRPRLDAAEGLTPSIALAQENGAAGPRSTAAGLSGMAGFLRALWAAVGIPHSPATGKPMVLHEVADVVDAVLAEPPGTRFQVLFPVAEGERDPAMWVSRGFVRGRFAGTTRELASIARDEAGKDGFEIVVDRLVVDRKHAVRLSDSVATAFRLGGERCSIELLPAPTEAGTMRGSGQSAPPDLDPADSGRPADLVGPGAGSAVDRPIESGSDRPRLRRFARQPMCADTGLTVPRYTPGSFSPNAPQGACPRCGGLGNLPDEAPKGASPPPCPACGGHGLRPESLWVRLGGVDISQVLTAPLSWLEAWLAALPDSAELRGAGARELVAELRGRTARCLELGLGYLAPGRRGPTLSRGETHRLRLIGQLGAGLSGVTYILDEPTAGLHPRDASALLDTLEALRARDNTLVVVEHDPEVLARSSWVIETGPGAGSEGGRLVAAGTPDILATSPDSPTGRWMRRDLLPPSRPPDPVAEIVLADACGRHLRGVDLHLSIGRITGVAGVSGSGKSSLIFDTLLPAARAALGDSCDRPGLPFGRLTGLEGLGAVEEVGTGTGSFRSPRTFPATLLGLLDPIRQVFAALPESKTRGFNAARFTPNAREGRCEHCQGLGEMRVELHLLPDSWVPCERCQGRRFNRETLEVRFKGLDISEILALPIAGARDLFLHHPKLEPSLRMLCELGLGYLPLGQRGDTLSGGEVQRLRLAGHLVAPPRRKVLFLLDEPSAGLHPLDVLALLGVLGRLAEAGHTIVVVDHDPALLARCDRLIELGPGAGPQGGAIVAVGTPWEVAQGESASALWLRKEFESGSDAKARPR